MDELGTSIGDSSPREPDSLDYHEKTTSPYGAGDTPPDGTDTDVKEENGDGESGEENLLRRKRQAKQFERLSRYLRERGYQWDELRGVFLHPNGHQVIRTQGIFHWKVVSDGGETPLFLAGSSLESENGVEMPAESWELGKLVDAIFLEPIGESYVEHRFHNLAKLVDGGNIQMYSAVVRLKVDDKQP